MSRRVLVTGASRGIGRATAIALAEAGYDIVVHYNSNHDAAQEVLCEIEEIGGTAHVLSFDVCDRDRAMEALSEDMEACGPFFGAVCNAGIIRDGLFVDMPHADWTSVLNTNLGSIYNVLRPIVPRLLESGVKGRIVTMSSLSGLIGNPGQVNYSASKAGIVGATKALALELARKGITVNCVAPGLIKTDMTAGVPVREAVKRIPMRRFGRPAEVAALVRFLFSEPAAYITGQVISVNGGAQ